MVRLDPQTTVASLLRAIPSTAIVFEKFGISTGPNEGKTLQDVCKQRGIKVEQFLRAMDEIDWKEESAQYYPAGGNGNSIRHDS